jgi:hypothetical protein
LTGCTKSKDGGNDEHIESQRLDQRKSDDHRRLDARGGSRLPSDGVHAPRGRTSLAQAAEA